MSMILSAMFAEVNEKTIKEKQKYYLNDCFNKDIEKTTKKTERKLA